MNLLTVTFFPELEAVVIVAAGLNWLDTFRFFEWKA